MYPKLPEPRAPCLPGHGRRCGRVRPQQIASSGSFSPPTMAHEDGGCPWAARQQKSQLGGNSSRQMGGQDQWAARADSRTRLGAQAQSLTSWSNPGSVTHKPRDLRASVPPSIKWALWQYLPQRWVLGTVPGARDYLLQEATVHPSPVSGVREGSFWTS